MSSGGVGGYVLFSRQKSESPIDLMHVNSCLNHSVSWVIGGLDERSGASVNAHLSSSLADLLL